MRQHVTRLDSRVEERSRQGIILVHLEIQVVEERAGGHPSNRSPWDGLLHTLGAAISDNSVPAGQHTVMCREQAGHSKGSSNAYRQHIVVGGVDDLLGRAAVGQHLVLDDVNEGLE